MSPKIDIITLGVRDAGARLLRGRVWRHREPRPARAEREPYVTDPNGYLWKIASSKRRPLLGPEPSVTSNGHAVEPQEVPVTIGVADMKRVKWAAGADGSVYSGYFADPEGNLWQVASHD